MTISPRLIRGGIVLIDPTTSRVDRIITLQYNPDSLNRTLQVRGAGGESGDHLEALRLKGPPIETIKLEAEIDATDQLEVADPQTVQLGIHPQLAALETIVYPDTQQLIANNAEAQSGSLEILPVQALMALFVWSATRILPVRITDFTITEEAFDTSLNPIRAKVSLSMRVLSIDDLGFDSRGGMIYLVYQQQKEQLARRNRGGSQTGLGITGIP